MPQPFTINHSLAEGGLSFTAVTNVLVSQCKSKALLFVLTFYVKFGLQIKETLFGRAESSVSFSILVMVLLVSFPPSLSPSQAIEKVYLGRAIKSDMDCISNKGEHCGFQNILDFEQWERENKDEFHRTVSVPRQAARPLLVGGRDLPTTSATATTITTTSPHQLLSHLQSHKQLVASQRFDLSDS